MKKLLFVTYHFPPDARVGALRGQKMVKYLPEFDWSPEVLTVREKHYEAFDHSRLRRCAEREHLANDVVPDPLESMAKIRSGALIVAPAKPVGRRKWGRAGPHRQCATG